MVGGVNIDTWGHVGMISWGFRVVGLGVSGV